MAKTIILFDVADPTFIRLIAHLEVDSQLDGLSFLPRNAQTARLSLDRSIGETLQIIASPVMGPALDDNGDEIPGQTVQVGTSYDNQWTNLTLGAASLFANGAADMVAGASASGQISGIDCTVEVGTD